ncbi:MAG TPA: hypothetical protein VLA37_13645 [Sphingomonadaceae bacterium]|nr:hypothetical protein [Sphingomonadaceae bacterium]
MGWTRISRTIAGAALLASTTMAMAQEAGEAIAPPLPRASSYLEVTQWPDLTGTWYPDWGALFSERSGPAKLTPAAQAKYDRYLADTRENGPNQFRAANCIPPGLPGVLQQPYPVEILYSPGRVTIFTEAYEQAIRIYLDRELPEDPDLFFNGNIVGHWEGDALVFEATGFNLLTDIQPGIGHSEQLRIDGRIALRNPELLVIEMTLTDPEVLAEPFVTKVAYSPDTFPLREWVCAENNRLQSGEDGANIDLGLDQFEDEEDPFGPAEGE